MPHTEQKGLGSLAAGLSEQREGTKQAKEQVLQNAYKRAYQLQKTILKKNFHRKLPQSL